MKFEEITDTIMRIIICIALLYLLFISIIDIVSFTNSRITLNTTSAKYINPSYDSLNLKYCNLYPMSESGKNVIDFENFKFLSIYLILFIIFWYNRIINIFSYTSLPNEIKILFYNKYYNYDIYKNCNNEYNLIYGFMIYILISLLFHSYVFYNEFNQIIFIGKSKKIRKQVEVHLETPKSKKALVMRTEITRIDFHVTQTEYVATDLHKKLIIKHTPKDNTIPKKTIN